MDLTTVSSTISAVAVVITVVVAAYAALNRETVKTLRENNGDLESRVNILTNERDLLRAENTNLTSQNTTLRSVVTGEAHLTALQDALDNHHREALAAINGIRKELS